MRLRNPFKRHKPDVIFVAPPVSVDPVQVEPPKINHGKIVKMKHKLDYELPTQRPTGGRVVRTMPKQLRKMKEQAENADL